jgi:hypothetical protein
MIFIGFWIEFCMVTLLCLFLIFLSSEGKKVIEYQVVATVDLKKLWNFITIN